MSEPIPEPRRGKDARGHQSGFELRGQLYRITGVDREVEFYEAKYQHQQLERIKKQAATLHMQLIPVTGIVS